MAADVKEAERKLKRSLEQKFITEDFYRAAAKMLSVLKDIETQAYNLEKEMPTDQNSSNYQLKMRKYDFIKTLYDTILSELFSTEKGQIVPSKGLIERYKNHILGTIAQKESVSPEAIWSDVNKGGSVFFNTGRTGARYQELIRVAPEEIISNEPQTGRDRLLHFGTWT